MTRAPERDESAKSALAELFELDERSSRFEQALTHKSYAHEFRDAEDNQRLEFLGDAVLGFFVSSSLLSRFPRSDEGQLTRTRAQIVSTGALAAFARAHEVGSVIRFGRGARAGVPRISNKVLADTVEALIAATLLDAGQEAARSVCERIVDFGLNSVEAAGARDPKSELQERVQALGLPAPIYTVVETQGPAHDAEFSVRVYVGEDELADGRGRSRRKAEARAAENALSSQNYLRLAVEDGSEAARVEAPETNHD